MKCDKCGLREVTSYIKLTNNGQTKKIYLCSECAAEYRDVIPDSFGFMGGFGSSPMGLLPELTKFFEKPSVRSLRCPDCGTSSEEFLKTGFVGCARCYEAFAPLVAQTVKKLQQSDRHIGKSPLGTVNTDSEELKLKAELQEAIDRGEFYKLADIGERLRKLSAGKKDGN